MAQFSLSITEATLPTAIEDFFDVLPNVATTLDVIDNDFLGVQPTVVTIEIAPNNGTATVVGSDIEYTPTNGFTGSDVMYYRITDDNGDFDIAKINIEIG